VRTVASAPSTVFAACPVCLPLTWGDTPPMKGQFVCKIGKVPVSGRGKCLAQHHDYHVSRYDEYIELRTIYIVITTEISG